MEACCSILWLLEVAQTKTQQVLLLHLRLICQILTADKSD